LPEIRFSRHAKRRIKLYDIPEPIILTILEEIKIVTGKHEVVKYIKGFELPIKIVFDLQGEVITVITAYPLKRGTK